MELQPELLHRILETMRASPLALLRSFVTCKALSSQPKVKIDLSRVEGLSPSALQQAITHPRILIVGACIPAKSTNGDVDALPEMPSLEVLDLTDSPRLSDLTVASRYPALTTLDASDSKIADLSPLRHCPALH